MCQTQNTARSVWQWIARARALASQAAEKPVWWEMHILCPVQVRIICKHETGHWLPSVPALRAQLLGEDWPPSWGSAALCSVPGSPKRQGDQDSAKHSIFVLQKSSSSGHTHWDSSSRNPCSFDGSGEIARGRISWWMSWAARVSQMDLCRIFTSAVLAGAPVLPYQDPLLAVQGCGQGLALGSHFSSFGKETCLLCPWKPSPSLWQMYLCYT